MKINTTPGETYIVLSTGGCTVTTGAGKQIKKLAAGQDFFTAMTGDSIISDDNASVIVATGEILSMLNADGTGSDVQATLRFQPVTSQSALPATGENGVIYLVPNGAGAPNQYTEWVWTGSAYEQLGDVGVDLSGYAKLDAVNTFTTDQMFNAGLAVKGDISVQRALTLGKATLSESNGTLRITNVSQVQTLVFESETLKSDYVLATTGRIEAITIVDCIYPSEQLDIGSHISMLTHTDGGSLQTELRLGSVNSGIAGLEYHHYTGPANGARDMLYVRDSGMISLAAGGKLRCGGSNGISLINSYSSGSSMATLSLGADAQLTVANVGGIQLYTDASGIATLYIGENAKITGPGFSGGGGSGDGSVVATLSERVLTPKYDDHQIYIGPGRPDSPASGYPRFLSYQDVNNTDNQFVEIEGSFVNVHGRLEVSDAGSHISLTNMATLTMGEGSTISGPGWDAIVADIQAGAAAAAAEAEQESFTKLIFPPTGTATAEQDPSWITKKNILMETNGGQLNMTQLTATLAYAAQTPLAIAKRTLWLSTSPGTGDAVQWPANAVFPDDQPQDKIQQLNSNSTYWFDITYVGGSDTVLIRKVCSWAATTGESGPTE